ncbi:hypothetical protein T484DRAFT_1903845 [Baffinella frigidus]|nr:hypothetical protein T484DRAFT_1903845 [Cryptophyta sp. CCMP2293]
MARSAAQEAANERKKKTQAKNLKSNAGNPAAVAAQNALCAAPTLANATGTQATAPPAPPDPPAPPAREMDMHDAPTATATDYAEATSSGAEATDVLKRANGVAFIERCVALPSVEELMAENSQLQRELYLLKLYNPAFLERQMAPLIAAATAATDRAEHAEAEAKKATEVNEETEALLAELEALMKRKDKDHARDNARKDKEFAERLAEVQALHAAASSACTERDTAVAAARAATDRAELAEAEAKEANEEAGAVVAEAEALLAGARVARDRTPQEELARLQHDFDMYKAYHVGQMERKDEAHARDNARKEVEFAARLAEVKARLAAAEKEAAAGRVKVIVIED